MTDQLLDTPSLADAPLAVAIDDVVEVRAYFREEIFVAQRRDDSTVALSRYDYYRLIAALGAAARDTR